MITDANLVGGGDTANPNQVNDQNPDLTAKNVEAAVNTDPQAATIETIVDRTLAQQKQLSDIFNNPWTAAFGAFGYKGSSYVKLTDRLEEVTNSRESYEVYQKYILDIVSQYQISASFLADQDPDKANRAACVYSDFMLMIGKAVDLKVGYGADKATVTPDCIDESAVRPEVFEILQRNPANYSDVAKLQEWVSRLQFMNTSLMEMNKNLRGLADTSFEANKALKMVSEKQAELIEVLQKRKEKEEAPERENPGWHSWVDFGLSVRGGYESEAYAVRSALAMARDAKLKEALGKMVVDDTDEAFDAFEEYQHIQKALDFLTTNLIELAEEQHNHSHAVQNRDHFLNLERSFDKARRQRRADFKDAYSVFTEPDSDDTDAEDDTSSMVASNDDFLKDIENAGATPEEIQRFSELLEKRNATPAEQ